MNFNKLDKFMSEMPQRGFPACELAVSKDGEIVYRSGFGYSDSAKTRPVSNKDIYWIFSATKVITCIAAMRLVEEGRIRLDDPVSKYIPEFAHMKVLQKDKTITDAQNTMTIEHLFTMTGGMSYDLKTENIMKASEQNGSTLDVVRAMAKDPLSFEPGTRYKYSLCHDVLAAVVEVVSGMRFSEYLSRYIFEPLGVVDMGFRPTEEQKSRFSALYMYKNGTGSAHEVEIQNRFIITPDYDSGGAGLFSTVDEYMKIITVIACGGTTADGYRILKPETISMMGKNHLPEAGLNDFSNTRLFGYGWGLCGRAHMNPTLSCSLAPVGEFGWDGAAAAFSMIDAKNRVALYFGTHLFGCSYGYHMVHPTIRNLVYEGINS
jgi:CubicO group peptidase (beta-lactamase class C family)